MHCGEGPVETQESVHILQRVSLMLPICWTRVDGTPSFTHISSSNACSLTVSTVGVSGISSNIAWEVVSIAFLKCAVVSWRGVATSLLFCFMLPFVTRTPPLSPNALNRTKRDHHLSNDKDKSINRVLYIGSRFLQWTFGSLKIVSLRDFCTMI